jgi:hypothetical protein
MTDTTDKALDALIARYRQVASTMRKMKAATIEAYEMDACADTITALRSERDQWASMVGHIVACLPLKDIVPASATMCELIDAIKSGLAERDALRSQLATARADALWKAAEACTNVIKNYDVMKPDGITYEPMRVQKAAKYMVSIARQDILDLIDTPTPSAPSPEAVARAALAEFPSDDDREWIDNRADQLFRESERRRGGVRPATTTPQDFRDYFVASATAERLAAIVAKAGEQK